LATADRTGLRLGTEPGHRHASAGGAGGWAVGHGDLHRGQWRQRISTVLLSVSPQ